MAEEIKRILEYFKKDNCLVPFKTLYKDEVNDLLNYITNLQKENNQHISDIQVLMNKKENLERLTKKIQKENEKLKEELKYTIPQVEHNQIVSKLCRKKQDYKSRNEKAIEYIDDNLQMNIITGSEYFASYSPCTDLLNILEGGDE